METEQEMQVEEVEDPMADLDRIGHIGLHHYKSAPGFSRMRWFGPNDPVDEKPIQVKGGVLPSTPGIYLINPNDLRYDL